MVRTFTKVRKWAEEVGAKVKDSELFNAITVTLPNGEKFELENRESTSRRVINRGRGMKWDGSPKGLYMSKGDGYAFQERSQVDCIEKMSKHLSKEV